MVTSADVNVTVGSQLSVAVGVVQVGVTLQSIVVGAGSALITGAVTSCTFIVCDAVDELPQSSVAVHVLVIL